jgi:hypothetical protein
VTVPPRTWGHYAAATYERAQRNGHQVHDRARFEEHVALDGLRRLVPLAERWLGLFVVGERQLAEWLVDGSPSVYAQRRES